MARLDRRRLAACLVIVSAMGAAALAPAASADFQGTPGKIAYIDNLSGGGPITSRYPLKIWDPSDLSGQEEETLVPDTFHVQGENEVVNGEPSAPSFSPDGTKIAFSKLVEDPGVPEVQGWHSAIFVMNTDGSGGPEQITFPDEAVVPPPECESECQGHVVSDFAPTWSPNGKEIAFIRQVGASEADPLHGEGVQNVWKVSASGGGATEVTHGHEEEIYESVVWGRKGMVAALVEQGVGEVLRVLGHPTPIAEPLEISDWDVSPNGEKVAYTSPLGGVTQVNIDGSEEEQLPKGDGIVPLRYSPAGNGPLIFDCAEYKNREEKSLERCGAFEDHSKAEEEERNYRKGEPDRLVFDWTNFGGIDSGFDQTRTMWDVQAQQVPIIFVPGFLASNIKACGDTPWPPTLLNRNDMHEMDLLPNGETNDDCPDAGPDGEPAGTILKEIKLGGLIGIKDVTKTLQEKMGEFKYPKELGPYGTSEAGEKFPVHYFGWDWRKRAHDSVERLDEYITEVLEEGSLQEKEGVDRVVLFGHSYGGLLIRTYAGEHPERVARILTVGTPYWGAPKVVFPLAFGRETPFFGLGLDLLTNSDQMQNLARNLAGLYELFPSTAHYGPWLSLSGNPAGEQAIRNEVESLGGQPTLYGKAQTDHEQTFDGFENGYGQLDYQAVVGAGLPTPGLVNIAPTGNGEAHVDVTMVNGDTTVPLRSADQGSIEHPLGSQVPIQALCGVEHMSEPNDSEFLTSYEEWLLFDRAPKKLKGGCTDEGGVIEFKSKDGVKLYSDEEEAQSGLHQAGGAETRAAGGGMSIGDALGAGDVDVYELDPQMFVVTNDHHPVNLEIEASEESFTYTPIGSDEKEGVPLSYGPVSGLLEISPGNAGGPPTVSVDGQPLSPHPGEAGGGKEGTHGGGESHEHEHEHEQAGPPAGHLGLVGVRYHGGRLQVTLEVPSPGSVQVQLKAKAKLIAKLHGVARKAGNLTLSAKPSPRVRKLLRANLALKVTAQLKPQSGTAATLSAKAKLAIGKH